MLFDAKTLFDAIKFDSKLQFRVFLARRFISKLNEVYKIRFKLLLSKS